MAKLVYALNISLDGYVDHDAFAIDPALFRHFIEQVRGQAAILYGRRMYETMRVWDDDGWEAERLEYATVWRKQQKWVASRTLKSVGPNATLISDDLETAVRRLKADLAGEIGVAGPELARSLTDLGLIDEYWLYLHPFVVGGGKPYFAAARPPLRLISHERIGAQAVRLIYAPA